MSTGEKVDFTRDVWTCAREGDLERVRQHVMSLCPSALLRTLSHEDDGGGGDSKTLLGLLLHKCDNSSWRGLLMESLKRLSEEERQLLILKADCKGRNAVHWAVRSNDMTTLNFLLDNLTQAQVTEAICKTDTWGRSSVQWAARSNFQTMLTFLLSKISMKSIDI